MELRRNSDIYLDVNRKFIIQGKLVNAEERLDVTCPIPENSKPGDMNFPECPDCGFDTLKKSPKGLYGVFCDDCYSEFVIMRDNARMPYS